MRGRFITFEGGEGTGKSTQAKRLAERLKAHGLGVVLTREPGGSPGAEAILFAAARDDHVRELIRPALDRGHWVVCDRFADSTRIYQGILGNIDARVIRSLERIAVGNTRPDLTFILDMPVEQGLKRASRRRGHKTADRFESETIEFHTRLREAYRELADSEPGRCILIDARQNADAVAEAVWTEVSRRLDPASASLVIEGARS